MSILLGILTFILIIVSIFLVLVVLAQKSKDGGVGAALGGGATEAAFGADTGNVLTNATKYATIVFFVLAFALYLGRIWERKHAGSTGGALPTIAAPAATPAPAPAAATPATTTSSPEVKLPTTAPATGTETTPATTPAAPATAPATTTPNPEAPKK
jgi:preprotein translocase subunit SecG